MSVPEGDDAARTLDHAARMAAELPYKAWLDGLPERRLAAKTLAWEFNRTHPADRQTRAAILRRLLGKTGSVINVEPPFQCDYGSNIEVGENFYANHGLIVLDVARVAIGDDVLFGPEVILATAGHPLHHAPRTEGWEHGIGIRIEDRVWLGARVTVNPGVTIGRGSVVGSGSVVTRDVPPGVLAAGNPCRVLRPITEDDRTRFHRDRLFDVPVASA